MIKFFYGEDEYSVQMATKKIVADFVDSQKTDMNVNVMYGNNFSLEKFVDSVMSMPFLGDKKLTVVHNFILENTNDKTEKELIKALPKIPASSEIVFSEAGKVDIRGVFFKFLDKQAEKRAFPAMTPILASGFIRDKAKAENIKIESAAVSKLSFFVGPDSWRLSNEINKLANFARSEGRDEIKSADVELLVEANVNLKIFDLTDALADRNLSRTLNLFADFQKAGEDIAKIFSMIVYQIRNMLIIEDLLATNNREVAKASGLHPFVVQKTERAVKKIKYGKLARFYHRLADVDWGIKTGSKEVDSMVTMLFVDFCENDRIV